MLYNVENNPIISIHDQGAGGNCNVVKEVIYPKGAEIDIQTVVVGDHRMSIGNMRCRISGARCNIGET